MRALTVAVLAGSLLLAACGGDDGGPSGGSVEAFCQLMEESEDSGEELDPTSLEGQAELEEILAAAPSEIRGDLELLFEAVEQFEDVDEDDPEAFGAAMGLMFDPEFIAAAENLDEFAVEECGLEPTGSFGDGDDALPDDDDPLSLELDGVGESFGNEDGLDSGGIREYVETNGSPDVADALGSIGVFNNSDVSLSGSFDTDQAIEVCELAGEYAGQEGFDVTVEVQDAEGNVVATGPDSAGLCDAA